MSSFFRNPRNTDPRHQPGEPASSPVRGLSIYDPAHLGTDTSGHRVTVPLMYSNMLLAGVPGSGKSVALNNIVAHTALCVDAELVLIDGKLVELLPWAPVADKFVGNHVSRALSTLRGVQTEMDARYDLLARSGRRKITPADGLNAVVVVIDELAYFSVTVGTKDTKEEFINLLRDLVARGRAAGIIVIAATQRPSADIIPTSLRDLFSYRLAFRCTTDSSSDIILGNVWASEGHSAKRIAAEELGVGLLLTEGGYPRRIKTAYLSDHDIQRLVARAAYIRTHHTPPTAAGSGSSSGDGGEAA
jgi:S-DNA-T family DNA segregation ATPase FtsK/SpoIIIE